MGCILSSFKSPMKAYKWLGTAYCVSIKSLFVLAPRFPVQKSKTSTICDLNRNKRVAPLSQNTNLFNGIFKVFWQLFSHARSMALGMTMSVCQLVDSPLGLDWNISKMLDVLPLNFEQTLLIPREWMLLTLMIPWRFLQCHRQIKVFTYPLKYLHIYWMKWHNI